MKIDNKRAAIYKKFYVTVRAVPPVLHHYPPVRILNPSPPESSPHHYQQSDNAFGVVTHKIKEVSVKEGEDVALRTGETEIQREDDMEWTFGDEGEIIAEINIKLKIFETYDGDDGRFGDRLELDRQTGSLIIRDTRTSDSGVYTMKIDKKGATIYKRFYVTVSHASGAKTHKITTLSVKAGERVNLFSGESVMLRDEVMWMFGKQRMILAEIKTKQKFFKTYAGDDGKFKDRLELDRWTGSLIIRDSRTSDSGVYTMQIVNEGAAIYKKFHVTVRAVPPVLHHYPPVKILNPSPPESSPHHYQQSDISSAPLLGFMIFILILICVSWCG